MAEPIRDNLRIIGAGVLSLGAIGFAWMVITTRRAGTPIHNSSTVTAIVETGPFRFIRNRVYLFGSTAYAGVALLLTQLWSLYCPWCLPSRTRASCCERKPT